jgi:TatD DNase family protein
VPGDELEYFDSHCHLTAERFDEDRADVIARAKAAGVVGMIAVASDRADSEDVARLVGRHPGVWGTAGIHPHDAGAQDRGDLDRVRDLLETVPGMVAVGETGLDYFYDHSPRESQRASFLRHIELAGELDLPLVVHCREADRDMAAILRDLPDGVRGVLHCFVGDDDLLDAGLDAGWMISFTGLVTFKNFDGAPRLRRVPDDRLMVETDAPYLAPVPFRGRRNEPAFVVQVCDALAELRGRSVAEMARITTDNARRFYGLGQGS